MIHIKKSSKTEKKGQFLRVAQAHSCGCTGPTSRPSAAGVVNTTSLIPVVVPSWSCLCRQQGWLVCGFVSAGSPPPRPETAFSLFRLSRRREGPLVDGGGVG